MISTREIEHPDYTSAAAGTDFQPIVGQTISFLDGEDGCKAVDVRILDNEIYSEDSVFEVTISDVTGGAFLTKEGITWPQLVATDEASVQILIRDDDPDTFVIYNELFRQDINNNYNGETFEFQIETEGVRNISTGISATLSMVESSGVELLEVNPRIGTCTIDNGFTCQTDDLPNNFGWRIDIKARLTGNGAASATFVADTTGLDTVSENNTLTVVFPLKALPTAENLFPLVPGATHTYKHTLDSIVQGNYTQETLAQYQSFNGLVGTGRRNSLNFSTEYFNNDAALLDSGVIAPNGDSILYTPAIEMLPENYRIGETYSKTGQMQYGGQIDVSFPYTSTTEIVGFESPLVSGFSSQRALHTKTKISSNAVSNGYQQNVVIEGEFWFVPTIGIVRERSVITDNLTNTTVTERQDSLLSFTFPDTDEDGLSDNLEILIGTDRLNPDTDNDNVSDGDEHHLHNTSAINDDTDGDGIDDGAEINVHQSNPLLSDSDGDGLDDYAEIAVVGSDPTLSDSDSDGLDDLTEHTLGITNVSNPDSDNDGLNDGDEINLLKSDPTDEDSDNDGITDGDEAMIYFTNPVIVDCDDDGQSDLHEIQSGSNPNGGGQSQGPIQIPTIKAMHFYLLLLLIVLSALISHPARIASNKP